MPLSYGSSLTGFGLFGARNRDRISGTTGKTTATTRKSAIGPNVLSTPPRCRGRRAQVPAGMTELDVEYQRTGRRAMVAQAWQRRAAAGPTDKPRYVAAMFGRIARALRPDEHADDRRPGRAWRRGRGDGAAVGSRQAHAVLDVGTGTGQARAQAVQTPRPQRERRGRRLHAARCCAPAPRGLRLAAGRRAAAAVRRRRSSTPSSAASSCATWPTSRAGSPNRCACCGRAAGWSCSRRRPGPPGWLRPLYRLYFRRVVPAARAG